MKKVYFKNESGLTLFPAEIPDFKDGKTLMNEAKNVIDVLLSEVDKPSEKTVRAAYETLGEIRRHYSPIGHTEYSSIRDFDLKDKGYHLYCAAIDSIMRDLAIAIIHIQTAQGIGDEKWASHYSGKAFSEINEAIHKRNGLADLADGKIWIKPSEERTCDRERQFDYVKTTSSISTRNGKSYYLPDFGGLDGLKETLKQF